MTFNQLILVMVFVMQIEYAQLASEWSYDILNVALAKDTTQSSTLDKADSGRAVDGVEDLDSCSYTQATKHNWWQVDLGRNFNVNELIVYIPKKAPWKHAEINIIGSDKPARELNDFSGSNSKNVENGTFEYCVKYLLFETEGPNMIVCHEELINRRYIIIEQKLTDGKDSLALCEVEIIPVGLHNPVYRGTASMSGDVDSSTVGRAAFKALDGNKDQCFETSAAKKSFWQAHLPKRLNVTDVVVMGCSVKHHCAGTLRIFTTEEEYSDSYDGTINLCETRNKAMLEPGKTKWFTCRTKILGRYLVITHESKSKTPFSLCEVQVAAECENGRHGSECDQKCSKNCDSRPCDKGTGVCVGCQSGFWGEYCDRGCPANCEVCVQSSGACMDCEGGQCANDGDIEQSEPRKPEVHSTKHADDNNSIENLP